MKLYLRDLVSAVINLNAKIAFAKFGPAQVTTNNKHFYPVIPEKLLIGYIAMFRPASELPALPGTVYFYHNPATKLGKSP